jgi:hypothetical protein
VVSNVSGFPAEGCSDREATPSLTANNISKMRVSVNHQLEVHKAPAFLSVVLDVGSPQSALDVDKDTSWRTEKRRELWAKCVHLERMRRGTKGESYYIFGALFYTVTCTL